MKTGLSIETLKDLAHQIASAESMCVLWAMGITQHIMGADSSTAISNLLLITGNYMRTGTGAYPLRGHNNVQGAGDLGCAPKDLPGGQKVADSDARAVFETIWKVKMPTTQGLDNHTMIDAIYDGKLKSLYLFGEEMTLAESNETHTEGGLAKLDFLVVQDIFFTHTCQYADVILPASPSLEKDGTFTNTERRIQRLYQVFEPLEGSRPDWRIIQDVANRLGANWTYDHPSQIFEEVAGLCPIFAGVTYERLEGYKSLHWPVAPDGTDSPLLYTKTFNMPGGKAKLHPVQMADPTDLQDEEFDLHLNNGRLLEIFHEGNMTYKTDGIRDKVPHGFVEVSPELAEERGIVDGTWVHLTSRNGRARLQALVTDRVQGKELFVPINSKAESVNRLTGNHVDKDTHTPAYKETSVKMKVLGDVGKSPLPKTNPRYGHPTPQTGVEVERKWKRPDYHMPGNGLIQIQTKQSK